MLNSSDNSLTDVFKAILQSSPESMVLLSANHSVIFFNNTFQKTIFNHFKKTIQVGDDFHTYIDASATNLYEECFPKVLDGETLSIQSEISVEGSMVWVEYKMNPVYAENRSLIGVALYIRNINAEKKAEISMQESEMKFRRIIETAPIAILIVNDEMKIVLSNPETEKIFGYTHDEIINQSIDLLIPARFKHDHQIYASGFIKSPRKYQMGAGRFIPSMTKEGKELIVEVSLNTFTINRKRLVLAMIQDVTNRVKNEDQLKDQVQLLERIAWQHSHEIRRPVANIKGLIDLINMDFDEVKNIPNWKYLEEEVEALDKIIHKIVADTYRDYKGKK